VTGTCKLGRLLGSTHKLNALDRALLRGWLDNGRDSRGRRVGADALSLALAAEGHDVGQTTLKAHRRGACVCYRGMAEA
jgi:hypothetical protein